MSREIPATPVRRRPERHSHPTEGRVRATSSPAPQRADRTVTSERAFLLAALSFVALILACLLQLFWIAVIGLWVTGLVLLFKSPTRKARVILVVTVTVAGLAIFLAIAGTLSMVLTEY